MKFFIGIFLGYGCDRRLSSWRRPPRAADVKVKRGLPPRTADAKVKRGLPPRAADVKVKRGLPPRHIMSKGPLVRSASVPPMSKWTLAMDANASPTVSAVAAVSRGFLMKFGKKPL